jgi:hypothetical protein
MKPFVKLFFCFIISPLAFTLHRFWNYWVFVQFFLQKSEQTHLARGLARLYQSPFLLRVLMLLRFVGDTFP